MSEAASKRRSRVDWKALMARYVSSSSGHSKNQTRKNDYANSVRVNIGPD